MGMGRRKIDRSKQVFHNVSTTLIALLDSASVLKKWSGKLLQNTVAVEIKAASLRSSIHGARKRMRKGKSRRQISRVLEGLDLKWVEDETNAILRADAKNRFQGQVIDVAVDIHGIPYHGLSYEKKEEVNRSKQKDGTTRFHMFATAYLIGKNNKRFTLAIIFVPLGTTMRDIVRGLLYLLRRCGITIRRLLLDKGFYSIEVVKLLRRLNVGFIIPMRGNRLKKKKGSYSTVYTMKSTIDGKPAELLVRAVSVIKYNRGKRFKHHGAMQLCFIVYGIDMSLHRIAGFYRKRFGIESSYKIDKSIRARTSSRNPAIRMFHFNAAVLIQNFWVTIKQVFCKRIDKTSVRMITIRDFADILLHWIRIFYGENTTIGPPRI